MSKAQRAAERWALNMGEWAGWYTLAYLLAITYDGDMGQRSAEYTWDSAWARTQPEADQ